MATKRPSVAIFTNGAALGSIIKMILDRSEELRVVTFSSYEKLAEHMRIAPADLIVCDYEQDGWTAPEMLTNLRQRSPGRTFKSIILTSYVSREVRQGCRFAQVDEVIIKPMSPLFLEERVESHLATLRADEPIVTQSTRESVPQTNNIVSLFGGGKLSHSLPAGH